MKEIRLTICIPSTHLWEAEFGMSLIFLTNFLASHGEHDGRPMSFMIHNKRGSILANMRQKLTEMAIDKGATHLLWLDSDQTFPRDLVHRLLDHKKQVVACNIATKAIPASPTARLKGNGKKGVPLYTMVDSTGIEQVWRVGTGVMLIDLNVFKREGMKQKPWFNQPWQEDLGEYTGEDWYFCQRLEEAGAKVYIDHDLSKEIGHVGSLNYQHDLVAIQEDEAC